MRSGERGGKGGGAKALVLGDDLGGVLGFQHHKDFVQRRVIGAVHLQRMIGV